MTLDDIKTAVNELTPDDFWAFVNWLEEKSSAIWDQEMNEDFSNGFLEHLLKDAEWEECEHPFKPNKPDVP